MFESVLKNLRSSSLSFEEGRTAHRTVRHLIDPFVLAVRIQAFVGFEAEHA